MVPVAGDLDPRIRIGSRIFRTVVGAQVGLEGRLAPDGRLHLLVIAGRSDAAVAALIDETADGGERPISGLPIEVETVPLVELDALGERPAAALFVGEPLAPGSFARLVEWSSAHGALLFSAFESDLERGAVASFSADPRVRPAVSLRSARVSGIEFRSYFLQTARVADP